MMVNSGANFKKNVITRNWPMKTGCLVLQMLSPAVSPDVVVFVCTEEEDLIYLSPFPEAHLNIYS